MARLRVMARPSAAGPRVLVLGAAKIAELAVARGLRYGGYEPVMLTWDLQTASAQTRAASYVIEVPAPALDPEGLLRRLLEHATRLGGAALLPGSEAALTLLGESPASLRRTIAVGCPEPEIVRRATDKQAVNEAARRSGLGVPPTAVVNGGPLPGIDFPAVVKPAQSEFRSSDGRLHYSGVRRVVDEGELRTAVESMPGDSLVQPYLQAPIRTVNGVAWRGQVVSTVHQWADRVWPTDCGALSASHTVPIDPDLEDRVRRLIGELQWSGIYNAQFLQHEGSPLLMDFNPRPYHSLSLAIGAGANLPAIWVDLLLGREPRVGSYQVGRRWRYLREDLSSLVTMARAGDRRVLSGSALPRPGTVPALFSLRDPRPGLWMLRRDLRRLRDRLARRRR